MPAPPCPAWSKSKTICLPSKHIVFDFDHAGHGGAGMTKKLQAHSARMFGHTVHDPARASDQAVTTFFLNARQTAQKLISHVLAQALLAEGFTGNIEALGTNGR